MAHSLKFDPTTREGAAIVALFNGIKRDIEETDGGWNGGDVVQYLTEMWLPDLGIDPEAGPIT